jgi:GT2 family glycosyltransferase
MTVAQYHCDSGDTRASVPEISVIIASYNASKTIERCLESLIRQISRRTFEILLLDSSSDGTEKMVRSRFPFVQLHHSRDRQYCGEARNHGLRLARAPIIAFLDADCYVNSDWIETIWDAHQNSVWMVGGIIDNGNPKSLLSWAYYFCEFNLWLPCETKREIDEVAGCCLSFKRIAYDLYGPFLERTYCSDTAFHWKLQQGGHRVLFHPAIRVYHTISCSLFEFLAHTFEHRSSYARVSSLEHRYSIFQRFLKAMLSLGMPLPLLFLLLWRVSRSRVYWRRFLLALPMVCAGIITRSGGEFWGYLFESHGTNWDSGIRK